MAVTLTIRAAQMAALSELTRQTFEDWMADHVRKFFPNQCDALGEAGVRAVIRDGRERATQHGFRTRADICKYIDLMIVLGRDFDTNGSSRWAARIVARSGDRSATMRALFAEAIRRLQR